MRKLALALALVTATAFVVVGIGIAAGEGPPSTGGKAPVFVAGNPTCSGLAGEANVKFDPPADGTQSGITIDVDGKYVSWSLDDNLVDTVQVVIVKGGPNANVYTYGAGWTSDSGLHAPLNPNGNTFGGTKLYGLSHVTFCFDPKD